MARTVDYLPIAIETGSNIEGQSSYNIDPIRLTGHQAGVAKSAVANKMWRQASVMVSAIANMLSEALDVDILDDGDIESLKAKLQDVLMGGRIGIMNTDTNFYVTATGSDNPNNDGLTLATAWASTQHAFDQILEKYDLNGNAALLNIGSGQNFGPLTMYAIPLGAISGGSFQVRGAGSGATRLSAPHGNTVLLINGTSAILNDLALNCTIDPANFWTGFGIWLSNSATMNIDRLNFQACGRVHIHTSLGANFYTVPYQTHSYTISGGSERHLWGDFASQLALYGTTVTVTGTPAFSQQTFIANQGAVVFADKDTTFVGPATGMRFFVDRISLVSVDGRSETVIPGSTAGYIAAEGDGNYFNGVRVP